MPTEAQLDFIYDLMDEHNLDEYDLEDAEFLATGESVEELTVDEASEVIDWLKDRK